MASAARARHSCGARAAAGGVVGGTRAGRSAATPGVRGRVTGGPPRRHTCAHVAPARRLTARSRKAALLRRFTLKVIHFTTESGPCVL